MSAAIEDVRLCTVSDEFSEHLSESIDQLDSTLDLEIAATSECQTQSVDNTSANTVLHLQNVESEVGDIELVTTVPSVGDRIEVFQPDKYQYFIGTIGKIKSNGNQTINYDDGDQETLNHPEDIWRTPETRNVNSNILPTL